jgi:guanylate kinase
MVKPPVLSLEERAAALEVAKRSRQLRAHIKEQVKNGEFGIEEVLRIADANPAVARMRVLELLESISGVGKIRAELLMEKMKISPSRRIMGLGRHQVAALIKEFSISKSATPGRLIVLSGPGGVGKSSVAKHLKENSDLLVSVSATTRSPRINEVEGVDYFFYSQERFDRAIANNEFLEWADFAGNRYGTPKAPVEKALSLGKSVLLEIEIAGAKQIKAKMPEAILVFLEPPTWEELVARLEGRGTDSPERRAARLALAQEEMEAASFFDKVLINEQVEQVAASLISLSSI